MIPRQFVLILIALSTLARLVMAGATGLGIDESYAATVARSLSLSYFDHPPLHFWLVGGWAKLWGSEAPLLLRLPFILLFAGTIWFVYRLGERLLGPREGAWGAAVMTATPVFVTSSIWVLPDGPLLFFLAAAANVLASILMPPEPPRNALALWLLTGLLAGLALLSKYHGVFLLSGVFLWLLTVPSARRWLATPGPWLGALVAALLFLPVIVWNAENGWASFAFQLGRGGGSSSWTSFGRMIGGELLYLSPFVSPFLIFAFVRGLAAGPTDRPRWFLAMLAAGPIVVFNIDAAFGSPLPHWTAPGWLFVFPLLGGEIVRWQAAGHRWVKALATIDGALIVVLAIAVFSQARFGWLADVGLDPGPRDPTLELRDYTESVAILRERGDLPDGMPVAATHWIFTGKVGFGAGPRATVLCLCAEPHQFGFINDPARFEGRDILVLYPGLQPGIRPETAKSFSSFTELSPVTLTRNGRPGIRIGVFRGTKYLPGQQ